MTNIIADINDNRHVFKSSVDHFFSRINISKQLKISNFYKESGFSCTQILKELFTLVSTDTSLPDKEIIRIYGKRWDIEVFFKVCKSNLALSREFQGRSYDMLTAATAIVFMRYAMLSIEARNQSDDRTIGELFCRYCQELQDIRFSEALLLLIARLIEMLKQKETKSIKNKLQEKITESFLNALPGCLKCQLLLRA